MRIDFAKTISLRDFIETQRALNRKRRLLGYAFLVGGVLVLLALDRADGTLLTVALAGLVLVFLVHEVLCPFVLWPLAYRNSRLLRAEYQSRIDDDGIVSVGESAQTKVAWDHFRRWSETRHLFLLHPQANAALMIPKRCFTPDQLAELRQLFREKIGGRRAAALAAVR